MCTREKSSAPDYANAPYHAGASDFAKASSDRSSDAAAGKSSQTSSLILVSAIMVTREQEAFIREGIEELMQQSVADRMEVIVVDAGSQQSEWAVIADLQRRHRNLISLRTTGETAVNLALRLARGRYLTILSPSDRMRHDAYEKLAAALEENPEAMLAYGDTCSTVVPHETFAEHTSAGKMLWPDYTQRQLAHVEQVAPHPLWRRELHDSIGPVTLQGEAGIRWLLQQVAERFRMLHIAEFTGLKLELAQKKVGALRQPVAATVRGDLPEGVQPEQRAQVTVPSVAPGTVSSDPAPLGADEAYSALKGILKGPDLWQASSALKTHLGDYPDHAVAHNDYAAISYQLGEKEKALRHYRIAAELAPGERVYRKNLADLLFVEAGEVDEAIEIYLELLRQAPGDLETLLNLGIISAQVGQPEAAETFFQKALEIEPWNEAARERLGELKDLRAGVAEDLCVEDEETAAELYEKAQAMVTRGEAEEAERELEGLLLKYPGFAPAHNDLGVLRYQKGDKDEALRHYEKAAALAPGSSIFQKNLADFYFVEGRDVDGAIAIYLDLLRKEPGNVETLMSLGKICSILGRPEEAQSFYHKVTQLEPWNRDARESLESLAGCAN